MLRSRHILISTICALAAAVAVGGCTSASGDGSSTVAQPQQELAAQLRPALETVVFEPDSALLTGEEQDELTELVAVLLEHNGAQITITGDTGQGDTGNREQLALNRAKEVARFLSDFGVARALMTLATAYEAVVPSARISADTTDEGGLRYRRWNETGNLVLTDFDFNNEPADFQADLPAAMTPIDECDQCMFEIGGLITPETSGEYTFWLSADDEAVLELSPSADDQKLPHRGGPAGPLDPPPCIHDLPGTAEPSGHDERGHAIPHPRQRARGLQQ